MYNANKLIDYADQLLITAGLDTKVSRCVSESLVDGDLLGHTTHGLGLLPLYIKEIVNGNMSKSTEPVVLSDRPASLLWDGLHMPGPWLMTKGYNTLKDRAQQFGVASLVIRNCHHTACLATYLQEALEHGFIMLIANASPNAKTVAPHGGTRAVMGTNPIAMSFPLSSDGVLVDMAISKTTNGMVARKLQSNELFDTECLQDSNGVPTKDPKVYAQQPKGTLLPIAEHKGFAMGLMVEALSSGLAGWTQNNLVFSNNINITLYSIDAFAGMTQFNQHMDVVAHNCHSDPGVRLPGERALQLKKQQLENGVILHNQVITALTELDRTYNSDLNSCII